MSDKPPKKGSGEHQAVKFFLDKIEEVQREQLPELHALNERLRKLTEPPEEPDTLPAPSPNSESGEDVVQVPKSAPIPSEAATPPAPESKR